MATFSASSDTRAMAAAARDVNVVRLDRVDVLVSRHHVVSPAAPSDSVCSTPYCAKLMPSPTAGNDFPYQWTKDTDAFYARR